MNKLNNLKFLGNSEKAFVAVLFPFALMAMLAALGLIVDSTNLYAARVKAGAAAEQGVISAIGARILERSPGERGKLIKDEYERTYLSTRFGLAVKNNLGTNGIDVSDQLPRNPYSMKTYLVNSPAQDVKFEEDKDTATLKMRGTVSLSVPVFFGGVYNFFKAYDHGSKGKTLTSHIVQASAIGELRGSAFVFLVDMSNSQACPSVGDCLCNTTRRNENTVGGSCRQEAENLKNSSLPPAQRGVGNIRIEDIKNTVNFIMSGNINGLGSDTSPAGLDPKRDRVSIVIYNNSAQVLVPFDLANPIVPGRFVAPGYNIDLIRPLVARLNASDKTAGVVDPIVPSGNTNISDAVMTAHDEIRRVGLLDPRAKMKGRINVLLLSEGAATAMRVQPSNQILAFNAPGKTVDKQVIPAGDYLNFELSMQTGSNTFTQIPGPMVKTVSYKELVSINNKSPDKPINPPVLPKSQDSAGGYDDAFLPPCHLDGAKAKEDLFSNDISKRSAALRQCLGGTWQTVPAKPKPIYGSATQKDTNRGFNSSKFTVAESVVNDSPVDFRHMYYLAAVRAVELLTDDKITLFTLSWGPEATNDPTKLFNLGSVSNVKKDVLLNLSNDANYDQTLKTQDKWSKFKDYFGGDYGFEAKKFRGAPTGGYANAPDAQTYSSKLNLLILQAKVDLVGVDQDLKPH